MLCCSLPPKSALWRGWQGRRDLQRSSFRALIHSRQKQRKRKENEWVEISQTKMKNSDCWNESNKTNWYTWHENSINSWLFFTAVRGYLIPSRHVCMRVCMYICMWAECCTSHSEGTLWQLDVSVFDHEHPHIPSRPSQQNTVFSDSSSSSELSDQEESRDLEEDQGLTDSLAQPEFTGLWDQTRQVHQVPF